MTREPLPNLKLMSVPLFSVSSTGSKEKMRAARIKWPPLQGLSSQPSAGTGGQDPGGSTAPSKHPSLGWEGVSPHSSEFASGCCRCPLAKQTPGTHTQVAVGIAWDVGLSVWCCCSGRIRQHGVGSVPGRHTTNMCIITGSARLGAGRAFGSLIFRLLNTNHLRSWLVNSRKTLWLSKHSDLSSSSSNVWLQYGQNIVFSPCVPANVSLVWLIFNQANIQWNKQKNHAQPCTWSCRACYIRQRLCPLRPHVLVKKKSEGKDQTAFAAL